MISLRGEGFQIPRYVGIPQLKYFRYPIIVRYQIIEQWDACHSGDKCITTTTWQAKYCLHTEEAILLQYTL